MEYPLLSFQIPEKLWEIHKIPHGKIHESYFVQEQSVHTPAFVLQKINTHVFPQWKRAFANFNAVSTFFRKKNQLAPELIPSKAGSFFVESHGIWRLQRYIPSEHFEILPSLDLAKEAGILLGKFHRTALRMDVSQLKSNVPDFHNTPKYYRRLKRVLRNPKRRNVLRASLDKALACIEERSALIHTFAEMEKTKPLRRILCHNDPKLANMLFEKKNGKGLCLIDWDTLDLGLLPYDFGDSARSLYRDSSKNFDVKAFHNFCEGYLKIMQSKLSAMTRSLLFVGVKVVTLELSMRFLIDYLLQDPYFKVSTPHQNLENALLQQKRLLQMEAQEKQVSAFFR
jgi:N-acetylhexosamine 1-kinase